MTLTTFQNPAFLGHQVDAIASPVFLLAHIESSAAITGAYAQWEYTLQPVSASAGYIGALTFSDIGDEIKGVNVAEFANTASNISGIDPDNLPTGFAAKPCKGYVVCWRALFHSSSADESSGDLTQYWQFCLQTVIDGDCP